MKNSGLEFALEKRRSVRAYLDEPIGIELLDRIVFALNGTTSSDGKRAAPSANGLYPLSALAVVGTGSNPTQGIYGLRQGHPRLVKLSNTDLRRDIAAAALGDQDWIQQAACIITLFGDIEAATETFLDQPPRGKRGELYTYIEAGAAAQNAMLQATCLGIGSVLVAGIDERATSEAYGVLASGRPILHICFGWPDQGG